MSEQEIERKRIAVIDAMREAIAEQFSAIPEPLRGSIVERVMQSPSVVAQAESFTQQFTGRLN